MSLVWGGGRGAEQGRPLQLGPQPRRGQARREDRRGRDSHCTGKYVAHVGGSRD